MNDSSHHPLPASLVRQLTDKLYEKRKGGALELEKLVRDFIAQGQMDQVEAVLSVLGNFVRSPNPHSRKGGLIGLAAAAIAMGTLSEKYANELLLPVLECLQDPDCHIRYYACEASYNIIKMTRKAAMIHFSALFDAFCQLSADPDKNTRNGAELMERQLKDIVVQSEEFDVANFVSLLRQRIYSKNVYIRRYLISWIHDLQAQPGINLVHYLKEILDGMFQILTEDTPKIRELCETVMGDFLRAIIQDPQNADLEHMVNVLIVHAQSPDKFARLNALTWLYEFLNLDGQNMLYYAPGYLIAVLPCLACDGDFESIREVSERINEALMKVISDKAAESEKMLELPAIVNVFEHSLCQGAVKTKIATLEWIHNLYQAMPVRFFGHMEELFHCLLQLLSDPSDEVVSCDIRVLSDLCSSKNRQDAAPGLVGDDGASLLSSVSPYFINFMKSLLSEFQMSAEFLDERGIFVIRQLCIMLDAENAFRTLAVLLNNHPDKAFVSRVVQMLSSILLTAPELYKLRRKLKSIFNGDATEENLELFACLYKCWAYQPVALLALCLISYNYQHAARLVHHFYLLEVDSQFLCEVDKFIQLLESPIFTRVRLHLLYPEHQQYLAAVLYGLLMLLPQTTAFHTLRRRLKCLPHIALDLAPSTQYSQNSPQDQHRLERYFENLFKHFLQVLPGGTRDVL